MKTGLYGIVANSKTRVRCLFCGVFIPKANKCIDQHTNGSKHQENKELMSENGLSFKDEVLYCKPCGRNLTDEESVPSHIDGEDHSNWMAAMDDLVEGEFITFDQYLSSEKDEVFCDVCHSSISCSLLNIESHVNSMDHRTNITERLKPLNGIFPVANNDEVWCKVCNAYIDNTVQSVMEHIDDDDQHMQWFTEVEDLTDNHDITLSGYLTNEHEFNVFCNKCNESVVMTLPTIENHVNSASHLNQNGL